MSLSRRRLRLTWALPLPLLLAVGCVKSPAMKSPLREALAQADTPAVEDATRACLESIGYKADPVDTVTGGANVISATNKDKVETQVYVHPPDEKPRITGGPDDDKFWSCLGGKLGSGGGDDSAGGDKSDKSDHGAKGDTGDTGGKGDDSNKGGNGDNSGGDPGAGGSGGSGGTGGGSGDQSP